ncbi:hypothetical protein [Pseudooceanicola sp. LIPI14-2-Ac024]|uniref:hypothetical protein n=1 Tax=Pseudooceanicola sp. LIPI14-2-Ac024 TaxID=3344875 RepID=UPI0035CEDD0B
MKRLLSISRYPAIVVFVIAAVSAAAVALGSLNLLTSGLALLRFVREHGWTAIMVGGWRQVVEIALYGCVSLAFFLLFKICESDLVIRYRNWQDR